MNMLSLSMYMYAFSIDIGGAGRVTFVPLQGASSVDNLVLH